MRTFTDSDALAGWNQGAKAWEEFIESGSDYYRHEVHGPALLAACEPLQGRHVLDLGCGQGYFARQLVKGGSQVTGIDLADGLLAIAKTREQHEGLGIDYREVSASHVGDVWPSGTFDLVSACMSLQDMADVPSALRAAFAVLRPGGRMVFSVPHPATDTPYREWERDSLGRKLHLNVDRYFETGADICNWNMRRLRYHWSTPYWRYTLSDWTSMVIDAGFEIRQLLEPRPTAAQVAANPNLEDCYRMPFFLIFNLAKPADATLGRQP